MKETFKKQYRDLEMRVLNELRELIIKSGKPIKVNVFNYSELGIVNDRLTFFDSNGYEYSLWSEASLEDLIDILTENNPTANP
jgi:hypothetical protein